MCENHKFFFQDTTQLYANKLLFHSTYRYAITKHIYTQELWWNFFSRIYFSLVYTFHFSLPETSHCSSINVQNLDYRTIGECMYQAIGNGALLFSYCNCRTGKGFNFLSTLWPHNLCKWFWDDTNGVLLNGDATLVINKWFCGSISIFCECTRVEEPSP